MKSNSDVIAMYTDLDNTNEWSNRWQIQFNFNKCKVLSVSTGNPHNNYTLSHEELLSSE